MSDDHGALAYVSDLRVTFTHRRWWRWSWWTWKVWHQADDEYDPPRAHGWASTQAQAQKLAQDAVKRLRQRWIAERMEPIKYTTRGDELLKMEFR